jgi:putative transposase
LTDSAATKKAPQFPEAPFNFNFLERKLVLGLRLRRGIVLLVIDILGSSVLFMFEKVCGDFEAQLVEMNGQAEHVHLLINYPPKQSVSSLVNSLKGVSSRLLRLERPDIEKHYWKDVLWSPSYFAASCGGAPQGIIKQYIEQQKTSL